MMMRLAMTAALAITLLGCGAASGRIAADALGVSARDAHVEARSVATVWSSSARLRWVEGEGISASGVALAGEGAWTFHYTAPNRSEGLTVRVMSLQTTSEERPATSPPGIIIGDNAVGTSWVDSRVVMGSISASGASVSAPLSMRLVPMQPERWIVGGSGSETRWEVHAETGEVLSP